MAAVNGRRRQVFYGWWIVCAAMVGMSTAPSQFAFGSLGLFILPLSGEFGWNRAEISLALTVFTVSLAVCLPLIGRLTDRIGPRRVVVPSIVVCGLALAAIPLMRELWHLWLIFLAIGTLGAGANNLPYMLTISSWFNRRRGLAIGLAMAGAGFGFTYVPPLVQYVIDGYGWRPAYWVLAAITILVAAPVVGLVFRDTPAEKGLRADGEPATGDDDASSDAAGLDVSAALRRREFWLLWAMFCALSFSLYGLLPHFVPLLTDRGMLPADAAWAASSIGVTIIIARVVIGYLIDRFFAPRVALVFFLLSAAGIGLLAASDAPVAAFVAAILVGLSIGAEVDLLAYLSGRYFGLRHFGAVYGLMFAALLVGTSAGPVSFGAVYELQGSYLSILVFCALLNVAASFVMALMPQYPDFGAVDA
ncbi:MAG: MFS transporter [Gammaproteobacteria bacterium]